MKEKKTSTLRMTKPRKLCRAKLVLDMLVPGLRRAPYSRRSGNHCPPSRKHTPCFAVPTTSTLGWGCGSDFRTQSDHVPVKWSRDTYGLRELHTRFPSPTRGEGRGVCLTSPQLHRSRRWVKLAGLRIPLTVA